MAAPLSLRITHRPRPVSVWREETDAHHSHDPHGVGVCDYCESRYADMEAAEAWAALSPAQRIADRWWIARYRVRNVIRNASRCPF